MSKIVLSSRGYILCVKTSPSYLSLQLTLALLQLRDVGRAFSQHGLLLLERKLQLQVLFTGALTNQTGAVELVLQRGHLRREEQGRTLNFA